MPNIPPKANRRGKNCFSPVLYRDRNAIERMFCRLKDFRRVATRYEQNAVNFLAAVCIAATVSYWLWVWSLSTAMICSSVNLARLISPSSSGPDSKKPCTNACEYFEQTFMKITPNDLILLGK